MQAQMVSFSSPTCNPCKAVKPVLAELAEENTKILWVNVDTTNDPAGTAKAYNVTHVPVTVAVFNGKEVGRHGGTQLMGYFSLTKRLNSLLPK
jgi:thioredoxin-like negative regulator of GroEL